MKLEPLAKVLLLASSLGQSFVHGYCGTNTSQVDVGQNESLVIRSEDVETHVIDVYFHVASSEANKDLITERMVDTQFDTLRSAFLPHGFDFRLVNISRIVNDTIATAFYNEDGMIGDYDSYVEFFKANRRGPYDALNVYFFSDLVSGLGGSCNLPSPGALDPEYNGFWLDGCIVNANTMPEMPAMGDDSTDEPRKGHVAIHEVGHWLGLLHTFHGRYCDVVNDQVEDTPAQAGSSQGCPIGRDSCPDLPGIDPIHNYMDYSDDTCTNEFSQGQEDRMQLHFSLYRKGK